MSNSQRSRRHFTTEQKVTLLKRHLVDKVPVSDLCNEEELQPSVFYQWQRQLFENLTAAFTTLAARVPASGRRSWRPRPRSWRPSSSRRTM